MTASAETGGRPLLIILRALGLGDFLTGVPALRALAAAYPDHYKILAAPRVITPLAALTGAVDEVADTAPLTPLGVSLLNADVTVNLHGKGPQSHRILLDTCPARLVAFRNPQIPESADGPEWRENEHEVARWCRMLEHYGIPADPDRLELPHGGLPREAPVAARGATIIHPGAASAARQWPIERWSSVARYEREAGRAVILTGGPDEARLVKTVASGAGLPDSAVYAGHTGLMDLAALIAAAGRVVCGDTGVAHLATAFRTPSVVLFGPTPPALWGPPAGRGIHRTLWTGSTGDPHANRPDPGLLEISVGDVLAALDELPEHAGRHRPAKMPGR